MAEPAVSKLAHVFSATTFDTVRAVNITEVHDGIDLPNWKYRGVPAVEVRTMAHGDTGKSTALTRNIQHWFEEPSLIDHLRLVAEGWTGDKIFIGVTDKVPHVGIAVRESTTLCIVGSALPGATTTIAKVRIRLLGREVLENLPRAVTDFIDEVVDVVTRTVIDPTCPVDQIRADALRMRFGSLAADIATDVNVARFVAFIGSRSDFATAVDSVTWLRAVCLAIPGIAGDYLFRLGQETLPNLRQAVHAAAIRPTADAFHQGLAGVENLLVRMCVLRALARDPVFDGEIIRPAFATFAAFAKWHFELRAAGAIVAGNHHDLRDVSNDADQVALRLRQASYLDQPVWLRPGSAGTFDDARVHSDEFPWVEANFLRDWLKQWSEHLETYTKEVWPRAAHLFGEVPATARPFLAIATQAIDAMMSLYQRGQVKSDTISAVELALMCDMVRCCLEIARVRADEEPAISAARTRISEVLNDSGMSKHSLVERLGSPTVIGLVAIIFAEIDPDACLARTRAYPDNFLTVSQLARWLVSGIGVGIVSEAEGVQTAAGLAVRDKLAKKGMALLVDTRFASALHPHGKLAPGLDDCSRAARKIAEFDTALQRSNKIAACKALVTTGTAAAAAGKGEDAVAVAKQLAQIRTGFAYDGYDADLKKIVDACVTCFFHPLRARLDAAVLADDQGEVAKVIGEATAIKERYSGDRIVGRPLKDALAALAASAANQVETRLVLCANEAVRKGDFVAAGELHQQINIPQPQRGKAPAVPTTSRSEIEDAVLANLFNPIETKFAAAVPTNSTDYSDSHARAVVVIFQEVPTAMPKLDGTPFITVAKQRVAALTTQYGEPAITFRRNALDKALKEDHAQVAFTCYRHLAAASTAIPDAPTSKAFVQEVPGLLAEVARRVYTFEEPKVEAALRDGRHDEAIAAFRGALKRDGELARTAELAGVLPVERVEPRKKLGAAVYTGLWPDPEAIEPKDGTNGKLSLAVRAFEIAVRFGTEFQKECDLPVAADSLRIGTILAERYVAAHQAKVVTVLERSGIENGAAEGGSIGSAVTQFAELRTTCGSDALKPLVAVEVNGALPDLRAKAHGVLVARYTAPIEPQTLPPKEGAARFDLFDGEVERVASGTLPSAAGDREKVAEVILTGVFGSIEDRYASTISDATDSAAALLDLTQQIDATATLLTGRKLGVFADPFVDAGKRRGICALYDPLVDAFADFQAQLQKAAVAEGLMAAGQLTDEGKAVIQAADKLYTQGPGVIEDFAAMAMAFGGHLPAPFDQVLAEYRAKINCAFEAYAKHPDLVTAHFLMVHAEAADLFKAIWRNDYESDAAISEWGGFERTLRGILGRADYFASSLPGVPNVATLHSMVRTAVGRAAWLMAAYQHPHPEDLVAIESETDQPKVDEARVSDGG